MDRNSIHEQLDRSKISDAEWQTRLELAAVYRLIDLYGWSDLIYNHAAARVPGEPSKFLIKRHDCLYTEVTASNLAKVDMNDDLDERQGVNRPGFTLHSGVMMGRPDVNASVHVHTEQGSAISALPTGLRMISQPALRFHENMGYHEFEGITETFDERERIARDLGNNNAMIMRYHGLLTVGPSCVLAFNRMKHLLSACEIQLKIEATGQKVKELPEDICRATAAQFKKAETSRGPADMPAYMRLLDQTDPSYRT